MRRISRLRIPEPYGVGAALANVVRNLASRVRPGLMNVT